MPYCDGAYRSGFNTCAEWRAWEASPPDPARPGQHLGYTAQELVPLSTIATKGPGEFNPKGKRVGPPPAGSEPMISPRSFVYPLPTAGAEAMIGSPGAVRTGARSGVQVFRTDLGPSGPGPATGGGGFPGGGGGVGYNPGIPGNPSGFTGIGPQGGYFFNGQAVTQAGCNLLPEPYKSLCQAVFQTGGGGSGNQSGTPCPTGYVRNAQGGCDPVAPGGDVTPGADTPAERSMGASGIPLPSARQITRLECPSFANGKGILWMRWDTGQVVCLPRGVNGKKFGFIRKNKPRPKPYIRRSEIKALKAADRLAKKAKEFAKLTGQTCHKRGRGR